MIDLYLLFNRDKMAKVAIELDQAVRRYNDAPDRSNANHVVGITFQLLSLAGLRPIRDYVFGHCLLLQWSNYHRRLWQRYFTSLFFVFLIGFLMFGADSLSPGVILVVTSMLGIKALLDRYRHQREGFAFFVRGQHLPYSTTQSLSEYLRWKALPPTIGRKVAELMRISSMDFLVERIRIDPKRPPLYVLYGGVDSINPALAAAIWVGDVEGDNDSVKKHTPASSSA